MLFPEGFLQGYLATPSHVAATAMDLGSARFEAVLRRLAGIREPLYDEIADLRFDTAAMGAAETAAKLGHLLDARWRVAPAAAAGGTHP
jgi:hypothetical protein